MIQVNNLQKQYGNLNAVNDVSFTATKGQILGLLGPNGAGKSTIMRILSGYLTPSAGSAQIAGFDVANDSVEVRRRLGYLQENPGLYMELRVREYLDYRASIKGVPANERVAQINQALEFCNLSEVQKRIIGQLSKGFRQRVSLAAVLIHNPEVLILDEPTVGLDPNQMRDIRTLIKKLGEDRTVLFSTHILSEVEAVCDRVIIVDRGKVLLSGETKKLTNQVNSHYLTVELLGDTNSILNKINSLMQKFDLDLEEKNIDSTIRLNLRGKNLIDTEVRSEISNELVIAGASIIEFSLKSISLEEIFAKLTDKNQKKNL